MNNIGPGIAYRFII